MAVVVGIIDRVAAAVGSLYIETMEVADDCDFAEKDPSGRYVRVCFLAPNPVYIYCSVSLC